MDQTEITAADSSPAARRTSTDPLLMAILQTPASVLVASLAIFMGAGVLLSHHVPDLKPLTDQLAGAVASVAAL